MATKTPLNEIIENVKGKGCKIDMGTVKWREIATLNEEDGAETNAVVTTTNRFFLGRNN